MGPLTSRLMQFTEPLVESAGADDKGWCAAIRRVCSRPRLIAVVGDGTGVALPDFPGEGTAALPVVVVARALELQLRAQKIAADCIPAASMPGGALALWRNVSDPSIPPAERVAEWPDLVVQVGVTPIAPEIFPVPVVQLFGVEQSARGQHGVNRPSSSCCGARRKCLVGCGSRGR